MDQAATTTVTEAASSGRHGARKPLARGKLLLRAVREPRAAVLGVRSLWRLRQCTQVGRLPRVLGRVHIHNWGRIVVGDKLLVMGTLVPSEIVALDNGVVEIGDQVFINYGVSISARQLVRIGDRCQIGNWTMLMDSDFHRVEAKDQPGQAAPIVLEDDVWLGARVIVLKGVTIGQGAVVGAGSVVTKDIPPRSLAVGVPAQVVRTF